MHKKNEKYKNCLCFEFIFQINISKVVESKKLQNYRVFMKNVQVVWNLPKPFVETWISNGYCCWSTFIKKLTPPPPVDFSRPMKGPGGVKWPNKRPQVARTGLICYSCCFFYPRGENKNMPPALYCIVYERPWKLNRACQL